MNQPSKPLHIPVEHTTLANGLRVVASPDRSAPVVTVGVYYQIGFRLEPRGRSGFAHLFEHMMFQGSANAGKMEHIRLINSSGGLLNGTTNYDITRYQPVVYSAPSFGALCDELEAFYATYDDATYERLTGCQVI